MAQRPLCEHCNAAPSVILAHIIQPALGAAWMDETNVLALCRHCDRLFTALNPPLRRRQTRKAL